MKKSEAYHAAQISVISNPNINSADKLEILKILMDAESLEKYCEKQDESEVTK